MSFSEEADLGAEVELEVSTPMPSLRNAGSQALSGLAGPSKPHNLVPSAGDTNSTDSLDSLLSKVEKAAAPAGGESQGSRGRETRQTRKRKERENRRNRRNRGNNKSGDSSSGGKLVAAGDISGDATPRGRPGQRNAQIGVLYVSLQEARGLVNSDWSGLCSAFVRFAAGSSRYESKVASKSLVPTWKETFEMVISDTRECKNIRVEVWDQVSDFIGLFGHSNEFIGKTDIPLKHLLDSKATSNEWPVYGNDLSGEIQTGQVLISFQWVGVPLSPFYVTPSLNPTAEQRRDAEEERRQRSPSTTEYVKSTGKMVVLKVIRILILSMLLVTLLTVLIMPSLRVGAGMWFIRRWNNDFRPHWILLLNWWTQSKFAATLRQRTLDCTREVGHYYQRLYFALEALNASFKEAGHTWNLLKWVAAETMLVAAVLVTVKLILWADRNGIVAALMQPPWKWFDLDRVQEEFNERQVHMVNGNGGGSVNGEGSAGAPPSRAERGGAKRRRRRGEKLR